METKQIIDLVNNDLSIKESIGTRKEKTIHQFLKYFISNDSKNHEVHIDKNIVDVLIDNHIYEIQTKGFNNLRIKLEKLLPNYLITIVYPVVYTKLIYKVDENGEVVDIRKSPKKTHPLSIGEELYKIKSFLKHPNLSFKIVVFDVEEYDTTRVNRRKQTRLSKIDQYPKKILSIYDINNVLDWQQLIPDMKDFSTKDFMKETKLSLKKTSHALNVLRYLEVIWVTNKKGNAFIHNIKK